MRVVLQITAGASVGKRVALSGGQTITVGRTEWADFSVKEDPGISSVHFELACGYDQCTLRDVGSTGGTLVNGEPITQVELADGDEITAGGTTFVAHIEGAAPRAPAPAAKPTPATAASRQAGATQPAAAAAGAAASTSVSGPSATQAKSASQAVSERKAKTVAEIAEIIDLTEDAQPLTEKSLSPRQFFEALVSQALFADAVRFLAQALPPKAAIEWSCRSIRMLEDELSPRDDAAVRAAEAWLAEPTEAHRRAAAAAAEKTEYQGPSAWIALATFWSGGSIAPEGLPEIPADDHLCGHGVSGALTLAAVAKPDQAEQRYRDTVKLGAGYAEKHLK